MRKTHKNAAFLYTERKCIMLYVVLETWLHIHMARSSPNFTGGQVHPHVGILTFSYHICKSRNTSSVIKTSVKRTRWFKGMTAVLLSVPYYPAVSLVTPFYGTVFFTS